MAFLARLLRRLIGDKYRIGALDQLEQEGHDRLVADRAHVRAHERGVKGGTAC